MQITIDSSPEKRLDEVEAGQIFVTRAAPAFVYVRAAGFGTDSEGREPVVVLCDMDQHNTQGSYVLCGTVRYLPSNTPVTLLRQLAPARFAHA